MKNKRLIGLICDRRWLKRNEMHKEDYDFSSKKVDLKQQKAEREGKGEREEGREGWWEGEKEELL